MLKLTMKRPGKWEKKRQEEEEAQGKKKKRKSGEKYGKKVWQSIFQDDYNKITHPTCIYNVTLTFLMHLQCDIDIPDGVLNLGRYVTPGEVMLCH